jgi:hypothetical protein
LCTGSRDARRIKIMALSCRPTAEGNLLALHPTVKPVALVSDAILDCSRRGDILLDAFLGSGSTLIACERTAPRTRFDDSITKALARAHRWRTLFEDGTYASITELAKDKGGNDSCTCSLLGLTLTASQHSVVPGRGI